MGKRGNGEGTIYQRADGTWAAQLTLGYENGRAKRKSFAGKTRKAVHEQLVRAQRDQQRGRRLVTARITVGAYLEDWLEGSAKPAIEPSTYQTYRSYIRNHLIPALGRHELEKLTPLHVQAFLNDAGKKGLSARTIQQMRGILRKALNDAMRTEDLGRNVATLVRAPKVLRHQITPFTPAEARGLLVAVKDDPLEGVFVTAMATGLRQGELLGLTWDRVDLTAGTLSVTQQFQRVDGKLRLKLPKSRSSQRTLKLPAIAVAALARQRARQTEQRILAGTRWRGNPLHLVFTSSIGTPLDGPNVTHRFQRFLRRAGMRPQRFHDLRHCAASLLLGRGEDLRTTMDFLGHSTITLTANTYAHLTPAMRQMAADAMDAALTDTE